MRSLTLWRTLLGVDKTVVEDVDLDLVAGVFVASVRLTRSMRNRCGSCQKRCPRYDEGAGRRRWRGLDFGSTRVFLEADSSRVSCREHGVIVAAVPWARHQAGHTHHFDSQVAWL
ncbi:transposase family protein, partial [Cryobacterium sp. Sr3]|uniref:transposase family protein n=1 Tax=Cryobacterium sp. Sr3 TaxID=1259194 RepID=UPI001F543253